MKRSLFNTVIRSIRRTARMLMNLQSRVESFGNARLDPHSLSDYMRRDIGLMDGEQARFERLPRVETRSAEESAALVRLLMTPHAS